MMEKEGKILKMWVETQIGMILYDKIIKKG